MFDVNLEAKMSVYGIMYGPFSAEQVLQAFVKGLSAAEQDAFIALGVDINTVQITPAVAETSSRQEGVPVCFELQAHTPRDPSDPDVRFAIRVAVGSMMVSLPAGHAYPEAVFIVLDWRDAAGDAQHLLLTQVRQVRRFRS